MTASSRQVSPESHAGLIDFIESLTSLSLTRDPPSLSYCYGAESQSLMSLSPKGEGRARDMRAHRLPFGDFRR
jgi:hypothetical protein